MSGTQKALAAAIVFATLLHFVAPMDHSLRNYEVMPEMLVSVPYDAQAENPNFADGKTARAPVPGTIARGFAPPTANGLLLDLTLPWKELGPAQHRAWISLAPPAPGTATTPEERAAVAERDLRRGEAVFAAICVTCHGAAGAGDGLVTKRGVPPPPALTLQGALEMSDGQMFRIITIGQGNMGPHAAQVTRADRWRVIRFVRSLQKKQ